jgi:hypothetical protein
MAKIKKVTVIQLRKAATALMHFLEEYQTVDKHNADAIVEYEGKRDLLGAILNTKRFDGLASYSVLDLLTLKGARECDCLNNWAGCPLCEK